MAAGAGRRLLGIVLRAGGVLLCVVVMMLPAYADRSPFEYPDTWDNPPGSRILDYRVDLQVDAGGQLHEQHKVTMEVPAGYRGFGFPKSTLSTQSAYLRHVPRDIAIRIDGEPGGRVWLEPYRRAVMLMVGDEQRALDRGRHVFEFGWRSDNAVLLAGARVRNLAARVGSTVGSQLLLTPTGALPYPIDRLTIDLTLPADASVVDCLVTDGGACSKTGEGTRRVVVERNDVPAGARTSVTVGLDPRFDQPRNRVVPWRPAADTVFGQRIDPLLRVFVLTVTGVMLGTFLTAWARQRTPVRPVYQPPNGLAPEQAAWLIGRRVTPAAAQAALARSAEQGLVTRTPAIWLVRALVLGALGAALVLMVLNPQRMTVVGMPFALFVVFAAPVLKPAASTRLTSGGQQARRRVEGFRLSLANGHIDLADQPDLFRAYLPWAVALGCEQEWAEQHARTTAARSTTPPAGPDRHVP